ncbi:LysR substrate-binding domain-containing protein [Roseateles koreensis]|uniref:LysR substrate-binding domain-containing protein n=1 Tax=Roseateles koreensis TaxID=2987526 RepID=A0ABT5KUP6_9BURK|nr:LysR substrate-binding domain-containing protein [Roseateles koreensis]MDC8786644.1 LysR substrate-binding domain-containing protein [Roseateles koreensis]
MTKDQDSPAHHRRLRGDHLRIRHLRLLEFIGRGGSLSTAATHLNLSQPAVTKMLQELEAASSTTLVVRGARGAALTPAGQLALDRMRVALAHFDAALSPQAANTLPLLRVGMFPLFGLDLIPLVVDALERRGSHLRLQLREDAIGGLLQQLGSGQIDCALGGVDNTSSQLQNASKLTIKPMYAEELVVACGTTHPIAGKVEISPAELMDLKWVLMPKGSYSRVVFTDIFDRTGLIAPEPLVESASMHTNLNIVRQTNFCTLISSSAANFYARHGLVSCLRVGGFTGRGKLALISNETTQKYPPFLEFEAALLEVIHNQTKA